VFGDNERRGAVVDETVMGAGRDEKEIAGARAKRRRRRPPDLVRSAEDELTGS